MKRIVLVFIFVVTNISFVFADVDIEDIPNVITSVDHAKFTLERLEAVGEVREEYSIKVAGSIQDITSSFINNDYTVNATSLGVDGDVNIIDSRRQFYIFPQIMFLAFGMKVNGVGFGFGYQFGYEALTLGQLGLGGQAFTNANERSDRFITSHSLAFGMTLLEDALTINLPISFTVANNDYYSTVLSAPMSGGTRPIPQGNNAISIKPKAVYNTGGDTFSSVTTIVNLGFNEGSQLNNGTYEKGLAVSLSAELLFALTVMTDPVTINITPDIFLGIGFDSSSAFIDATSPSAHSAQYIKNNTPFIGSILLPVEFSSAIGNAISLSATPMLGIYYAQHGAGEPVPGLGANDAYFGAVYGMAAGFSYDPIENLTFNLHLLGIGGPNFVIENSDYIDNYQFIVGEDTPNGPDFTLGINAEVIWRF